MKKIIGFVLVALLTSTIVNAQQRQKRDRIINKLSVEQQAEMQTKHLVLALDLTKAQEKDIYALKLQQAKERKALMDTYNKNRENCIMLTDDEIYQKRLNRLDRQIEHKAEMKEILNEEQYTKWEKIQAQKKRGGKNRMANKEVRKGFRNRG